MLCVLLLRKSHKGSAKLRFAIKAYKQNQDLKHFLNKVRDTLAKQTLKIGEQKKVICTDCFVLRTFAKQK